MFKKHNVYPIFGGRWQPFHKGHLWAIKEIIAKYNHVIIMFVNIDPQNPPANRFDRFLLQTNPLDFWERYFLIKQTLIAEDLWKNVIIIPGWHPREVIKGEQFCLPQKHKRIWMVPINSEEELSKIRDLEDKGETVEKMENIPNEIMGLNATIIRSGITTNSEAWKHQVPDTIAQLEVHLNVKSKILSVFDNKRLNNIVGSHFSTAILVGDFLPFNQSHIELIKKLVTKYDSFTLCPVLRVNENSDFNWPDFSYTNNNLPLNYWDINQLIRILLLEHPDLDSKIIIHPILVKSNSFHINLCNLPSNREWFFLNDSYTFIESELLEKDETVYNRNIEKKINDVSDLLHLNLNTNQSNYIEPLIESRLRAVVFGHVSTPPNKEDKKPINVDIGVVTIVTTEKLAVKESLINSKEVAGKINPDKRFTTGSVVGKNNIHHSIALFSQSKQGQSAANSAYKTLVAEFNPKILFLIGIAGSIDKKVNKCDVVVSDKTIYYESQKETNEGTEYSTQIIENSPFVQNLIDEYFEEYGEYPKFKAAENSMNENYFVHRGPIGSGMTVVTRPDSPIIKQLKKVDRKTLCVETEAYGFSDAYEDEGQQNKRKGVLIIRGISDKPIDADENKDNYRKSCCDNAVQTMIKMIQLLPKFT